MAKVKTSPKREKSVKKLKNDQFDVSAIVATRLKRGVKLEEHDPVLFLKDQKAIRKALSEAFLEGDVDAVKDILSAHLRAVSKDRVAEITGVSRATVFRMLDHRSNPSFENVLKVVSSLKLVG